VCGRVITPKPLTSAARTGSPPVLIADAKVDQRLQRARLSHDEASDRLGPAAAIVRRRRRRRRQGKRRHGQTRRHSHPRAGREYGASTTHSSGEGLEDDAPDETEHEVPGKDAGRRHRSDPAVMATVAAASATIDFHQNSIVPPFLRRSPAIQ